MGAYTQYGYTDWSSIATKLGHGMTHRQCSTRWREMVRSHNRSLDIDRLMTAKSKGGLYMNLEPVPVTTVPMMQQPTAEGVSSETTPTSTSTPPTSSFSASSPSPSVGHIRYDGDVDIERAFRKQGRRKGPEGIKTNWTPAMVRPDHVIIYAMLVSPCVLGLYSVLYWSMRNLLYHTYLWRE